MAVLGAAAFPIWAVAGAALGRLAHSGMALVVGGCLFLASMCAGFLVGSGTAVPGTFVAILLWPPAGSTGFLTKIALHDNQALATAAFLGRSLSYAVAGYLLTRRRSAGERRDNLRRRPDHHGRMRRPASSGEDGAGPAAGLTP
jgi:hypothetical protein